jgi:acyl-CoA dehydrogenase
MPGARKISPLFYPFKQTIRKDMNQTELEIIPWILDREFTSASASINSLEDWKTEAGKFAKLFKCPVDRAIGLGFMSEQMAYAFSSGFYAALQELLPFLKPDCAAAFCVSEEGGNHPGMIKARIDSITDGKNIGVGWKITGYKSFVTGADKAELLFVAVSAGFDSAGKNKIQLVRLDKAAEGVTIKPLKQLPFIPEIAHAGVQLNEVVVSDDQILPGDGYADYVKPFRILEDMHVSAAILGYLYRQAVDYDWSGFARERLISLMLLIKQLTGMNTDSSQLAICFAGFQQQMGRLLKDLHVCWESVGGNKKEAWFRDVKLLGIAEKAREKRLEKAWLSLSQRQKAVGKIQ